LASQGDTQSAQIALHVWIKLTPKNPDRVIVQR